MDTNDEWITTRTGIKTRHMLTDDETIEDLAYESAKRALEDSGKTTSDIGLVIVACFTPTHLCPNVACYIKMKLGLENAIAFDMNSACSGFIYASYIAKALLLQNPEHKNAIVVGAESLSSIINDEDRGTFVLFGDGAGAAVFSSDEGLELKDDFIKNYDDVDGSIKIKSPNKHNKLSNVPDNSVQFHMNGANVFKFATGVIDELIKKINAEQSAWFIPHQANTRIIDYATKKLGIDNEKFYINIDKYGNTSAASVIIALDEFLREGKTKKDEEIALLAFGGGLTAAAMKLKVGGKYS